MAETRMRKVARDFLIPMLLLLALTALIAMTGSDLSLARAFHLPGSGWVYAGHDPWRSLYRYGIFPGYSVTILAMILLISGFFSARAYPYRKASLFLVLFMLLGPGLVVSKGFKEHWPRPRPAQLQVFGGDSEFHQIWERGEAGSGASFPSGHAAFGFGMIWPFFLLRRSSPRLARLFLAAGACYGLLMGTARMVQGGHFASDVLWSAGIVYLVGLALYYLLRLDRGVLMKPKTSADN
ncbi:MAG: hypothetical protein A2075_19770 [Geobacteraceae bacterium GWC2_58_44]|nr:MAG: hypothetical protein A2075_19770 [Geobacteraceae bacterium GWC2_58_44]HBG04999.1 hypothetical protein [Geobacter sp.]